uniref:Uncharacterized protein n=1 Tax=Physcomitrium patens TaxID=3218 RepID=A0A7I4EVJ2_PHYPA
MQCAAALSSQFNGDLKVLMNDTCYELITSQFRIRVLFANFEGHVDMAHVFHVHSTPSCFIESLQSSHVSKNKLHVLHIKDFKLINRSGAVRRVFEGCVCSALMTEAHKSSAGRSMGQEIKKLLSSGHEVSSICPYRAEQVLMEGNQLVLCTLQV